MFLTKAIKEMNQKYKIMLKIWGIVIAIIIGLTVIIWGISIFLKIKISPDAWLSYCGVLIGVIISSIVTFFVLYKTIEQNYILSEENKINSAMPILKVNKKINNSSITPLLIDYVNKGKESCDENSIEINIKNIGKGPARNIKINMDNYYAEDYYGFQYCFDLGSAEEIDFKIIFNKNMIKQKEDYKYIKFILEYIDIYEKRDYKMHIRAMKKTNSNFETFLKENEEFSI